MTLKQKAIKGGLWSGFGRLVLQLFSFVTNIVMARILAPEIFGIYGMMIVITNFIKLFQELGIGASIIVDHEINQTQISSLFWLNMMVSILLTVICIILTPAIAIFYGEPSINALLPIIALKFPIGAFIMVPNNIMKRDLKLKKIAMISVAAIIPASIIGITVASLGYGIWGLIALELSTVVISAVLYGIFARWLPSFSFKLNEIKPHLRFGINLQLGNLVNYANRNADNLIVGKMLGADALGFYQMAYKLMLWPIKRMSSVMTDVMFPSLSKIKNDKARVKKAFIEASRHIAWLVFPFVGFVFVNAENVIFTILGEKWLPAVPIFQILCLLGINQSIMTNMSWIFYSQGRTDMRLKKSLVMLPIFLTSFFVGLRWGVTGVAFCYTITSFISSPFILNYAGKLVKLSVIDIVKEVLEILLVVIIISCAIYYLDNYIINEYIKFIRLLINLSIFLILYLMYMYLRKDQTFVFIMSDIIKLNLRKADKELKKEV